MFEMLCSWGKGWNIKRINWRSSALEQWIVPFQFSSTVHIIFVNLPKHYLSDI